jgi:CHRD domain
MRRLILCLSLLMVVSTIPMAMADDNHNRSHRVRTHLSGFNEVHFVAGDTTVTPIVPPAIRGAISTTASGKFVATIDEQDQKIHYTLSYKNLEGTVTQGHIHFGQRHTVGGIVVWLCEVTTGPPGVPAPPAVASATPECPEEGTVEGTIEPAQVLAQTAQGFAAGDFDELVRAILAGAAYVNVHSSVFGAGEIRGHLPGSHDD